MERELDRSAVVLKEDENIGSVQIADDVVAVIAGLAEGAEHMIFTTSIFSGFTGLSAYAYMVFNLFSAPCFGAIGAMKKEFGSTKTTIKAILFQTGFAWVLASIIGMFGVLL